MIYSTAPQEALIVPKVANLKNIHSQKKLMKIVMTATYQLQ